LLIACLMGETKANLANRRFVALDFYIGQLEAAVWPKLNELFDNIMRDMVNVNVRALKQIVDQVKEEEFLARTVNFMDGCMSIGRHLKGEQFPLQVRMQKFIETLLLVLGKVAKEAVIEKDELTISANCHHILVRVLRNAEGLSQEILYTIETKLNDVVNRLVDKFLEEYFEKIVRFLAANRAGESNLKQVEETSRDFCENWKLKLANLKSEIEFRFAKPEAAGKILKILVHKILELYQEFCNFVKNVYPSYTSNLYPIHKLNVEIKTIINS